MANELFDSIKYYMSDFIASVKASMTCDMLIGKKPIHLVKYTIKYFKEDFIARGDWDI